MLYLETIEPETLDLLRQIESNEIFSEMRLVGGTALALQIGHRKSIDLDFFGYIRDKEIDFYQELSVYGPVSTRSIGKHIRCFTVNNIQVDFVEYKYPWLDDVVCAEEVRLASCRDIAAMKLSAITNRGTKKDFIDLAFLLEIYSLSDMITFYMEKYSDGNYFHVLKSLVFFNDAEDDPMPVMLKSLSWEFAKDMIIRAVTDFT